MLFPPEQDFGNDLIHGGFNCAGVSDLFAARLDNLGRIAAFAIDNFKQVFGNFAADIAFGNQIDDAAQPIGVTGPLILVIFLSRPNSSLITQFAPFFRRALRNHFEIPRRIHPAVSILRHSESPKSPMNRAFFSSGNSGRLAAYRRPMPVQFPMVIDRVGEIAVIMRFFFRAYGSVSPLSGSKPGFLIHSAAGFDNGNLALCLDPIAFK